jgi:drug/metabolite transporter (DMT)-like permease
LTFEIRNWKLLSSSICQLHAQHGIVDNMTHLPFTLLAYFLNGVSVVVDKVLLSKDIPDPLVYIFYFCLVGFLAIFFIPLTHVPSVQVFLLASTYTLLWLGGAFCMFKALRIGLVERVIPVIGTLIPIFLLANAVLQNQITYNQIWAVVFLILGIISVTLPNWKGGIKKEEIFFVFISSLLFAISYIVLRQAYQLDNFSTVFVWSRFVLIPIAIILLLFPRFRRKIITNNHHSPKLAMTSKVGMLFVFGQVAGGLGELLLTYSVNLANPALVNSLQGSEYVFLFIMSILLAKKYPQAFKEKLSKLALSGKIFGIIFIALGLYILAFSEKSLASIKYGVTFSTVYAKSLHLDPKQTYLTMLDDLPIKYMRFPIYWTEVEKQPGQYDFTSDSFYLNEAENRHINIILAIGYKVPRWPECFTPDWANNLTREEKYKRALNLVEAEVNYFKQYKSIVSWQVENEPLFDFGTCEKVDNLRISYLKKEIDLVKSLDSRPIVITDSGELSNWSESTQLSDVFGFSLYRTIYDKRVGLVEYPLPPILYTLKNSINNFLLRKNVPSIVSELQTEPWVEKPIDTLDYQTIRNRFPIEKLKQNVEYAQETRSDQIYLWGVEWWYYMKQAGYSEYLDTAKEIFDKGQ